MNEKRIGSEDLILEPETKESVEGLTTETAKELEEISVELEAGPKKIFRVNEIRDYREANKKVFSMSDGSEQAVFYPGAVHVSNEESGKYEEIDFTLVAEEDGKHYHNRKGHFKARFSCDEESDELFSVEKGECRVIVSKKKDDKKRGNGVIPKLHKKQRGRLGAVESLVFEDVETATDMEYTITAGGVKENILVKAKREKYRYLFVLRFENVTVHLDEETKRIAFNSKETGEEVFFIPAPFMQDAVDAVSHDVNYEVAQKDNVVNLAVVADSEWINAEERVFPIVIDPQVKVSGSGSMSTYSWVGGAMSAATSHTVGTTASGTAKRMYMTFTMPALPRNPRIKKAELVFTQSNASVECGTCAKFGLYQVTGSIATGSCTPAMSGNLLDYAMVKTVTGEDGEAVTYAMDITQLVDMIAKGETSHKKLVMKMLDESTGYNNSFVVGTPELCITYESSYGVNTSYRTHTHELGRFGQGSIDLQCGNLMFESEDFAWAGNRMPVTIKHLYNSALSAYQYTANSAIKLLSANFSAMKVGNGFKLNIMQSMVATDFQHEGESYSGYVYVGENGDEVYFKKSDEKVCYNSNSQCYNLYEAVNGGDMVYDPVKLTMEQGDDTYQFDSAGRLIKITDAAGNHMDITYTANRVTSVTDGAGREFVLAYSGDNLISVTAPDNTKILYTYSGDLLTTITYPDGKKVSITYASNKPTVVTLLDASENVVYKVAYTFSGDYLASVTEYGSNNSIGAKSTYSYSVASSRTLVTTTEPKDAAEGETADNVITTTYTFDDDGNIVGEYVYSTDTGKVGGDGEESGINPHSGDGGTGIVSNINNLLTGHNFESLSAWTSMPGNCGDLYISNYAYEPYAKFGKKVLRMQSYQANCGENGVYQVSNTLPAGQYTFSAYLRVLSAFSGTDAGAFIRVTDTAGNILGVSECLSKYDSEYTRLIVPFELASAESVQVQLLVNGKGTVYVDAAQLENNSYANAYNMLENGNFERGIDGWSCSSDVTCSTETRFNMSKSLCVSGSVDANRYACQTPAVRTTRSTRETFTLSGWAKGYGLPDRERDGVIAPKFRLRAVIKYNDPAYKEYGTEEFTADFSPCTEEWQFASVQFSKSKYRTIEYIRVYCDYGYNSGTVYFDDIQLVRNSLETYLAASDFVLESTGGADDDYAEVTEATDNTPVFNEAKDSFGNALTETTFTDGELGTIYRSFGFASNGNDLLSETDARGNQTEYTVTEATSKNEEVIDRCGNKTAYEYDDSGKTTKVISKKADGTELANVSYSYDAFDNMTEIVRGDGMKYALAYNEFHNLESIGIEGKSEKLIQYTYKNGNGRLKEMKYANGDTMKATYNSVGQMVGEKWYNASGTLTAHYKYVYDGDGNIVRSIDIFANKEYNYEYEEGRIVRATESDITLSGEIVTTKTVINTVKYYYDTEGKMTKKVITPASGSAQTIYYETNDDNTTVKFVAGGRTVTSHSKTDSFGRKVFDELQLGTEFVSRQFVYHAGKVTDEHKGKAKVKSSATTQLVSQIILSDGRTLSYEYDAEERITSITEKYTVDKVETTDTTSYTYDALGQLLTETNVVQTIDRSEEEPVVTVTSKLVNSMEYDNYGNITKKNDKVYTYGEAKWKDLLTGFDGKTIEYDAQGNPTTYLGHTLTWEKGRQLKSFDGNTYTYNANGIRTSKIVNGIKHEYTLDGTKILRESWGSNTLIPLYDNEESVCGILYNDVPYYFIKNLQGDVIAIVDKDAKTVARYSYDAWGVPKIKLDSSDCQIATVNPFRYRGYYYDEEIELYYLQSRFYDPNVGRFVNGDDIETIGYDADVLLPNTFIYCKNDVTNTSDESGMFSFNDLFKKFSGFIKKLFNKFMDNLKKQVQITRKYIKISVTVIKLVLDLAVTFVVNKILKWGIEKIIGFVMKKYIQKSTNSFIQFIGKILNHSATKWLIKALILRAVNLGYVRSVSEAAKSVAVDTILSASQVLSKINSICSACSSISGFIAFILDLADKKWDDYLTINFA